MYTVDARGLSCPEPALMAGEAMDANPTEDVEVLVSSATAKVNVSELAQRKGRTVEVKRTGDDYTILAKVG